MQKKQPRIFIISGPSRVGKDVITKALLGIPDLNLEKVTTATSRPQRQGEIAGGHYYFFTPEEFEQKIKEGYFLEWAVLRGGKYFGTPVHEFDRIHARNKNVVLNIDVQGARQLAGVRDDIVRIFVKPDSLEHLKERMKEAGFTKEQMEARFADTDRELKESEQYDYIVVNTEGKRTETVAYVADIIRKEIS